MSVRSSTDDEIALTPALSPFDKAQGRRWNGRGKFLALVRLRLCRNAKSPNFVIPSGARNLAFSARRKDKISRLRLEMTNATQPACGKG